MAVNRRVVVSIQVQIWTAHHRSQKVGGFLRFSPGRLAANAAAHEDAITPPFNHAVLRIDEMSLTTTLLSWHDPVELKLPLHMRRVATGDPYTLFRGQRVEQPRFGWQRPNQQLVCRALCLPLFS